MTALRGHNVLVRSECPARWYVAVVVAKEQRIERMCRFDPEVDERLVQAAAEDERSIAAEIRVFVREGLDRRSSNG